MAGIKDLYNQYQTALAYPKQQTAFDVYPKEGLILDEEFSGFTYRAFLSFCPTSEEFTYELKFYYNGVYAFSSFLEYDYLDGFILMVNEIVLSEDTELAPDPSLLEDSIVMYNELVKLIGE